MYNVAVEELKMAGERLPEMGHNIGVYIYSRWQTVYPVQTFNRNKFAATFDSFPTEPKGPTFLRQGLLKLEPILQQLSGKTVVFIFTDGQVTKFIGEKEPRVIAKELAEKYDVCFYLISSATSAQNQKMLNEVAKVNACSRVIPFEAFVGRPEYNSGALYLVKATEDIVTLMDRKVVGVKADNIQFKFNRADLQSQYSPELDEVGMFLQKQPRAYVVIEGHTDNVGSAEYNMGLSRRRAESVSNYLMQQHDVEPSRIVVNWYAYANPIANNATAEGRALNRRVEIAVGMQN